MKTQTVVVDPKVPQPEVIRQAVETLADDTLASLVRTAIATANLVTPEVVAGSGSQSIAILDPT